MSGTFKLRCVTRWVAPVLLAASCTAVADDTDIFIGSTATTGVPNVLFVVDNSSNWSAQNQAWPSGNTQGAAELAAMKSAVESFAAQGKQFNVGLMLITPCGTSGQEGGYVVHHVQSPTTISADGVNFADRMQQVINSISTNQSSAFNTCSSTSWSAVLDDVYRYFKGSDAFQTKPSGNFFDVPDGNGKTATLVDTAAYANASLIPTAKYNSPIGVSNQCANNYLIFIGNRYPGTQDDGSANEQPAGNDLQSFAGAGSRELIPLQDMGTVVATSPAPITACTDGKANSAPITCSTGYALLQVKGSSCGTGNKNNYTYSCTTSDFINSYTTPNSKYFGTNVAQKPDNEWADEWTRFLKNADAVTDSSGSDSSQGIQNITTYTVDPYQATRDVNKSKLLKSMADAGGGQYFPVTSEANLSIVIGNILGDILAKSSTFAAASLPISAANRTQNNNQVFIGMFRPDQKGLPRWFGNLKQFKLILQNGLITLGDRNGNAAINSTTGFVTDCAVSEWATDSQEPTASAGTNSGYWFSVAVDPPPKTTCSVVQATKGSSATTQIGTGTGQINPFSDLPDGPFVEKGGAAEVIRRNNDGATTSWQVNRNMFAMVSGSFASFAASTDPLKEWTRGRDVNDENRDSLGPISSSTNLNNNQTRPSLHGDVIHSRPLVVNYNTKSGSTVTTDKPTVVYYGANDGTFRAVDAATGIERWSFVDYDAFNDSTTLSPSRLQRLMDNTLKVSYPNFWPSDTVTRARDYFFDGSIGVYQTADNSKVWIYPVQRRGGAMIYAFDVSKSKLGSTTDSPSLMWRFGCTTPGSSSCAGDATIAAKMGQTWATPIVAPMATGGYGKPVVVVGGGYDPCEDTDTSDPASACTSAKGRLVVVLDAQTGTVVRGDFPVTDGSVAADVSVIAVANDTTADFAYVADTRGNVYRIDFASYDPSTGTTTPLAPSEWRMGKIATTGNGKKFLFAPAAYWNGTNVYVAIGSGDREHPLKFEKANGIQNRFYVFKDDISIPADLVTPLALDSDSSVKDYSYNNPSGAPTCGTAKVLPGGTLNGWYLNLSTGEQVVTSAVIFGGAVTFSTNLPTTANACTNNLGEARGYWLNLLNASSAIGVIDNCDGVQPPYSTFTGGGLPPSPVVANVDLGDGAGNRTIMIGAGNKAGGSGSSPIGAQEIKVPISSKRRPVYWFNRAE
jgi:type IV pilus assembly protein PilY1